MGATYDEKEVHDELDSTPNGWTTIVLDELDDGRWLGTQGGVSVQGHGETEVDTAAEYCRKISEVGDE